MVGLQTLKTPPVAVPGVLETGLTTIEVGIAQVVLGRERHQSVRRNQTGAAGNFFFRRVERIDVDTNVASAEDVRVKAPLVPSFEMLISESPMLRLAAQPTR